jgi:hypothetical protein
MPSTQQQVIDRLEIDSEYVTCFPFQLKNLFLFSAEPIDVKVELSPLEVTSSNDTVLKNGDPLSLTSKTTTRHSGENDLKNGVKSDSML